MRGLCLWLALVVPPAPALPVPATAPARWTADYRAGWALHYHPYGDPWGRSMRQVAARRGLPLDWSVDGYAATAHCERIGWYVRARIAGRLLTLQQIDCQNPRDRAALARRGVVLEVDWSLAHRLGFSVYGGDSGPGRAPAVILGWRRPE